MNGIICINKPQGFTSFDVVAKLRGILKTRKIGHAGTLDPMATGVLPVFVGNATKACDIMPDNMKSYSASFRLGAATDTQDSTGKAVQTSEKTADADEINRVIPEFTGNIQQIPPMYSAVSVNGQRLYELARKGIEIERKPRDITVDRLVLSSFDCEKQEGVLEIVCSKGTYVRTIIHDIGIRLGCFAHMTALVRTSSNGFSLSDCVTLDELQDYADRGCAEEHILAVERVFESLPAVKLSAGNTKLYRNGVKLYAEKAGISSGDESVRYRVFSDQQTFIGLAYIKDGCLRVFKNFA